MNAMTTAEYVVLEQLTPDKLQNEINEYAKQGYRLVQFTNQPYSDQADAFYNAVMVREPQATKPSVIRRLDALERAKEVQIGLTNNLFEQFEAHDRRIGELETRLQALDANYENTRQQVISHEAVRLGTRSRLESLETRCNEIEAKIDWSK